MLDSQAAGWLSEDDVKRYVHRWLEASGWKVSVAWGRTPGIDISAEKDNQRWLIEAKGGGSLPAMRVNYFLMMLGEILQRMDDPAAQYSIALPNMAQFRGLWGRLPQLAKDRLALTALLVSQDGTVELVRSARQLDFGAGARVPGYWVYENWTHRRARMHVAGCSFCNEGRGVQKDDSGRNGRWFGPFAEGEAAYAALQNTAQPDRALCSVCSP